MELSTDDLQELKRMATNMSGMDKDVINRVIKGINILLNANRRLHDELKSLKAAS